MQRRVVWIVVFIIILSIVRYENIVLAENTVHFSIMPQKSEIMPGEPCVLELIFENPGTEEIHVDLGARGVEVFWFEIFTKGGIRICDSLPPKIPGFAVVMKDTIIPGKIFRHQVVLNQWCSTLLPVGSYDLVAHFNQLNNELHATCQLKIQRLEEQKLKKIFSDLATTILRQDSSEEMFLAARMLTNSRSPLAVEALAEVFQNAPLSMFEKDIVNALGKIHTPEAIQTLVCIVEKETEVRDWIRAKSIYFIQQICSQGDNLAIRETCQSETVRSIIQIPGYDIKPNEEMTP